jgi:hypothetical protein
VLVTMSKVVIDSRARQSDQDPYVK